MFTGYQAITDAPKPGERQNFEALSKLTDPHTHTCDGYTGELQAQPSLFDAMFILDADKEECLRRGRGRKVDPTNGTIYHLEDAPPPEGDAKLSERLVEHFGNYANEEDMVTKLDLNHLQYTEGEGALRTFYEGFGRFDKPTGQGVKSCYPVSIAAGQKKDETFAKVGANLDAVLKFKQIATEREYQQVKDKIKAEE